MKKNTFIFGIVLALSGLSLKAQEIAIDMGTATNYISHGRTLSNDLPCFQPSVSCSFKSGTSVYAWFSLPYDRNTSFNDEYNLIVDQSVNLFEKHPKRVINLHGYANYWLNPRTSNPATEPDIYHGMKYNMGVDKNFVLHKGAGINMATGYDYYHYQTLGAGRNILRDGGVHEFLILFNKKFKKLKIESKSLISNNRGAVNPNIDTGWAFYSQHLSFFVKSKKVSLNTSINYQWTLNETIHTDNLLWFTLNISREFKI